MSESEQQTAADTATVAAVEAHLTAGPEKAAPLFNRATVEHRRAAREAETGTDRTWRDESVALPPMPEAPPVAKGEVDSAIAKLNDRGDDHAALVQSWGPDFGENLGYAKAAFKEIADTNPGLIAKFERSGLGDDPAVLQFLSKHGRLSAGMMGDFPTRSNEPMTTNRTGPTAGTNRGGSAREELDQLMADNPPGSASYKTPSVQRRVEALSRQIAGNGSVIGQGGRTS